MSNILTLYVCYIFHKEQKHIFTIMLFLHIDMKQVVEILPEVRQELTYSE